MPSDKITDESIRNALNDVNAKKRGRPPLSEDEKNARQAQLDADKAARKAQKDAARANKKLEQDGRVVHMVKVDRAAAKLPAIKPETQKVLEDTFNAFDKEEITGLLAHAAHRLRSEATVAAQKAELSEGLLVRIDDPASKYRGELAKVTSVQRIRCYVEPLSAPGKSVYLFTSLVSLAEQAQTFTNETSGVVSSDASNTEALEADEPFSSVG